MFAGRVKTGVSGGHHWIFQGIAGTPLALSFSAISKLIALTEILHCREAHANAHWQNRAFFRKRVRTRRNVWEDGTFGGVAYSRILGSFEGMIREDVAPFSEEEAEEAQLGGAFVGYLPDDVRELLQRVKEGYMKMLQEQVTLIILTTSVGVMERQACSPVKHVGRSLHQALYHGSGC